jgi:anti-sigma factor RsiW
VLPAYLHLQRCDEISGRLSEFLDGELDEPTRRRVKVHLATCRACERLAEGLAATIRALHRLGHGARGRPAPGRPRGGGVSPSPR